MNRKQRHLGREVALAWLYQIDVGKVKREEVIASSPHEIGIEGVEDEGLTFARELVVGVAKGQAEIDAAIAQYARGWSLSRMAAIDRNVLRIAVFELRHLADIPVSVSVDEAVTIAKRYGSDESGKFVNGLLGALIRNEKPTKEAAE